MLLKEFKKGFHQELGGIFPREEINSFFYWLVQHYLREDKFILALQPNYRVDQKQESLLWDALKRLKQEEPIQYIIGKVLFMDIEFAVDNNVLIPRPETENLVRWVLDEARNAKTEIGILDVGTGSGCIAISLAKNLPRAKVYALDNSDGALQIAKENAISNGVDIVFMKQDIFKIDIRTNFDIIVSNPPYVRNLEKVEMQKNVLDYEPAEALFVPNENPLKFYEAIAKFTKSNLARHGSLYLEINQYLAEETKQLLSDHNFLEIELRKDMYGKDRMIRAIRTD